MKEMKEARQAPPKGGKEELKVVVKSEPRLKLDPQLASILSWPPEVIEEIKNTENRLLEERLEELRRQIQAAKECCDPKNPDFVSDVDDEATIKGVPRQVRARLLQYASLLHAVDLKAKPEPTASVFIKFRGNVGRFQRLGVQVRSVAGNIATATVPLKSIPNLEADEDVIYVELSRPAFPELDQSVPIVQADLLHSAMPPVTGQGTVVGIVDYGIDFYHPDFRDPATDNTRLLFLWHQDPPAGTSGTAGAAPAPWGYGLEYTAADINNDLISATPYSIVDHRAGIGAHGTHVTGIAAGNGSGDGNHVGVAPGADIIFVDTVGSGTLAVADLARISDAINYIFTRAGATPCVINMSLGDNLGPHDGTSLAEQFIDNMLNTPGRAVTIAAGNANQHGKHATGNVPNGGTLNVNLNVPAGINRADTIEIWYDGHDRFDLSITPPGAAALGPFIPGAGPISIVVGTTMVTVTSVINDPRNGDNLIRIILQASGGNINAGNWQLQLGGNSGGSPSVINGLWHAWIDRNTGITWTAPTANNLTLGTPGTCRRAITVGSHRKTVGQSIAGSSGRGPTRDGRIKPEITAPGVSIDAPRSRDMTAAAPGALYVTYSGTSMAAPHIAGVIALLFQCRGAGLSAQDAKYILENLTDTTGIASTPDLAFGWGRARVANACTWLIQGPDVWLKTNAADTGVESYAGPAAYRAPDIWVRPNRDGGLIHANPEFGQENHVHVIVRNRGLGPALNTQVYLYWADPATNIPFAQWQTAGIRVGLEETNVQVIQQLNAGASTQTPLPFSWFPPAPGSNIHGDDHFCLLVRIENENDPSNVGPGGWQSVRDHNNIALKNVHIKDLLPDETAADATFYVYADDGQNALWVDARALPNDAKVLLQIPLYAIDLLPYPAIEKVVKKDQLRELAAICDPKERIRLATIIGQRLMEARIELPGNLLKEVGNIYGIAEIRFIGSTANLAIDGTMAFLDRLVLHPHEKIPARIHVEGLKGDVGAEFPLDVEQWVNGNPVGGITTIFSRRKEKQVKEPIRVVMPALKLIVK